MEHGRVSGLQGSADEFDVHGWEPYYSVGIVAGSVYWFGASVLFARFETGNNSIAFEIVSILGSIIT